MRTAASVMPKARPSRRGSALRCIAVSKITQMIPSSTPTRTSRSSASGALDDDREHAERHGGGEQRTAEQGRVGALDADRAGDGAADGEADGDRAEPVAIGAVAEPEIG